MGRETTHDRPAAINRVYEINSRTTHWANATTLRKIIPHSRVSAGAETPTVRPHQQLSHDHGTNSVAATARQKAAELVERACRQSPRTK